MRGFKRDETETIARQYLDPDSFVSMPKTLPCCPNEVHELLGPKDKGWQREKLWRRANGLCESCGVITSLSGYFTSGVGEWSHKAVKPADRCDCLEGSEWLCYTCHAAIHEGRAPRWTKKS